jgi:hypothetical protein
MREGALEVPVTHVFPAALMGSGLGKNTVWRGDYDIQLFDPELRRRYRLGSLRFGDLVGIVDGDTRFGPALRLGRITFGVIVHGDSTTSGHGPGVTPLLTGPRGRLRAVIRPDANLAALFGVRTPVPAAEHRTLLDMRRTALAGSARRPASPSEASWNGGRISPARRV